MSYHIHTPTGRVGFLDYILSESIKPVQTSFGLNEETNDHKYGYSDDPTPEIYTLFGDGTNGYYMVTVRIENGEIMLEHCDKYSTQPSDYTMDRYKTHNALLVFGKTLYVALTMITKLKLKQFCFIESDPGLGSVYKRMSQNEFLARELHQLGFGYMGEKNGYFIFKKLAVDF